MEKNKFFFLILLLTVFFLSGCGQSTDYNLSNGQTNTPEPVQFTGKKGEKVSLVDGRVVLNSADVDDGQAHFFNAEFSGKTVYFFVVKDKNGVYRAAGNACQVCSDSMMGFRQSGGFMVCNTCGNKYPMEKIATEKGGCNPVPINPDLIVKDGKLIIKQGDLNQIINFF